MIQTLKLTFGSVLLLLEVALGVVAAMAVFFALAFVVVDPVVLTLGGVGGGGLVAGGLARVTGRWLAPTNKRQLGWGLGLGTALVLLIASGFFLLRPRNIDPPRRVVRGDIRFESLSTGSRIACRVLPARGAPRRGGVIFLHGGLGSNAVANAPLVAALSPLTDIGYDVCLYDQIGGGLSERLDDPAGYTVERHVADLEALRQQLGWKEPVLIGESWGAQLIARYAAEHQLGIRGAVLVSPGPLRPREWVNREPGSALERMGEYQKAAYYAALDARLVTAMFLFRINPRAAYRFLPQAEAAAYGVDLLTTLAPGAVCDPRVLSENSNASLNLWVAQTTLLSLKREPADRLDGLAAVRFPVLVLRGDCDYGHEDVAGEYTDVFPVAELSTIPDTGHFLLLENREAFLEKVVEYLRWETIDEK